MRRWRATGPIDSVRPMLERALLDRRARRLVDLVSERECVPVALARQQHHELVAADAVDGPVTGRRLPEHLADAFDVAVARLVALRVVDLLQPVEVERHQREDRARRGAAVDLRPEVVMEGAMVPEARQVVGAGGGFQLDAVSVHGVALAATPQGNEAEHEEGARSRQQRCDCLHEVERRRLRRPKYRRLPLTEAPRRLNLDCVEAGHCILGSLRAGEARRLPQREGGRRGSRRVGLRERRNLRRLVTASARAEVGEQAADLRGETRVLLNPLLAAELARGYDEAPLATRGVRDARVVARRTSARAGLMVGEDRVDRRERGDRSRHACKHE